MNYARDGQIRRARHLRCTGTEVNRIRRSRWSLWVTGSVSAGGDVGLRHNRWDELHAATTWRSLWLTVARSAPCLNNRLQRGLRTQRPQPMRAVPK
jgi:hypothetical protein